MRHRNSTARAFLSSAGQRPVVVLALAVGVCNGAAAWVDELAAISAGYARLLEEGGALVTELKTVITGGNGLSLSDKERMDVVDQVYTKMLEYRNLTRYYTRKTISVSFIRSREKGDAHRVLALYGNPNDRYW